MSRQPTLPEIVGVFNAAEDMFFGEDKSTPFLMQITCDLVKEQYGVEIDHGDIATALADEDEWRSQRNG